MEKRVEYTTSRDASQWHDPGYAGENLTSIIEQIDECLTPDEVNQLAKMLWDRIDVSLIPERGGVTIKWPETEDESGVITQVTEFRHGGRHD